jgi:hypothetical protein
MTTTKTKIIAFRVNPEYIYTGGQLYHAITVLFPLMWDKLSPKTQLEIMEKYERYIDMLDFKEVDRFA